jgi:hypothetical protein
MSAFGHRFKLFKDTFRVKLELIGGRRAPGQGSPDTPPGSALPQQCWLPSVESELNSSGISA